MNTPLPVSAHILTFNSGKTLKRALESVRRCAEIIVIDGGSTDETLAIATEAGAVICSQRPEHEQGTPLTNFAAARNVGLQNATQPWILAIDSDEIASEELILQIEHIVEHIHAPSAYRVPRKYVLPSGSIVDYATTYPNDRMYFFHRDAAIEWIKPVHERPDIKPEVCAAPAGIELLGGATFAPLGSIQEYKEKNLQYLRIEAAKSQKLGWNHWIRHRLYHTIRSRLITLAKLAWIWLIPRRGTKLPLRYELLRFWYGWKLLVMTCPLTRGRSLAIRP